MLNNILGGICQSRDLFFSYNGVCYTGQIYDEGTGLYYYNARYYDSEGACFTSMDTYRGDNMLPLTLNLYMYCGGDPINYTDSTGHGFLKSLFKKISKVFKRGSSKKASKKATSKTSHRAIGGKRKKTLSQRIKSATKKVSKKVKSIKKKAKKAIKTAAITSAKAVIKSVSKVIPGAGIMKTDLALQASSIAGVIEAGRKGKKRTYSRTIEGSVGALLGATGSVGYAVDSKKHVGITLSFGINATWGVGGSVINKNNYYQTDTIEELNDKSSNEGVTGTYNGIAIDIEHNELLDRKGNKTSQGFGFGYGLGFGEKVWSQNKSAGIGFNWTKVINIW